jgi:siroheme synthase (precorrin-2 oxidase/ferrochelatase)
MPSWIAIAALAVAILSLLISLVLAARGRRAGARSKLGTGAVYEGPGVEPARVDAMASQLDGVARRLDAEEAAGRNTIQRVGIVRYNPFEDTGSNQSFVLAMLNRQGDGFVMSSLHSRQQTRVFLKQLVKGKADTALSREEDEAIRRATES